ncbi:glycine cleavage system protein T, partial [bacterium]|nr:glycine cleavage system protein T [bacterium]
MTDARYSPLHDLHVELGASFTDFAGWQMPVRYDSDLAEHHAVRERVGMFDISHMAEISVTGSQAGEFLDYAVAGKMSALALGQAKYTLLLTDDGTV